MRILIAQQVLAERLVFVAREAGRVDAVAGGFARVGDGGGEGREEREEEGEEGVEEHFGGCRCCCFRLSWVGG